MAEPNTAATSAIPGNVTLETGEGGLTRINVHTSRAEAHIYPHGAHVTHYKPAGQPPVLFMSRRSHFSAGKAIRGGIPVIFPWFGPKADDPSAPMHGFVRTAEWTLDGIKCENAAVVVTLSFRSSDATRRYFPHEFVLRYTVCVGSTLDVTLEVRNTSAASFKFEEALHTYLAVGDVRQASIEGLDGRTYLDKTANFSRSRQYGPIRIERETDRVYLDTPEEVTATDPVQSRKLAVGKSGSHTTVVWNPWIDKAKALSDFGDDEWPAMLCIETANAVDNAITLAPGASHAMRASISAVNG